MRSDSGSGPERTCRRTQAGGLPVLQGTATEIRTQHGARRSLGVSTGGEDIIMNNVDDFGVLHQCPDAHQLDKPDELPKVALLACPHGDDPTANTPSPERSVTHSRVHSDSFLFSPATERDTL